MAVPCPQRLSASTEGAVNTAHTHRAVVWLALRDQGLGVHRFTHPRMKSVVLQIASGGNMVTSSADILLCRAVPGAQHGLDIAGLSGEAPTRTGGVYQCGKMLNEFTQGAHCFWLRLWRGNQDPNI